MTTADEFYRLTLRDLYRRSPQGSDLNAIEMAGLLPLKVQWEAQGTLDRYWARVPVLQEDGTARMETLTLSRVERYADTYLSRRYSIEASMEPDPPSALQGA